MDFEAAPSGGRVVAIGVFDGVHVGHSGIVSAAVSEAAATGARPTVVTFHPHPDSVLQPGIAPRYLTSQERKAELLAELGVQEVVTLKFDKRFARLSPEKFCSLVLSTRLGATSVFVGENFRFGRNGRGLPDDLVEYGKSHGFEVRTIRLLRDDGGEISSTRIRGLLEDGEVRDASRLLGRPHRVEGVVVRGAGRGRTLGAPTANVQVMESLMVPCAGVYATRTVLPDEGMYDSVTSVGRSPTFGDGDDDRVETLILDYEGELYEEKVVVEFLERLREQVAFADKEALRAQISRDVSAARQIHEEL